MILSPTSAGAKRWGAANAPQLGPMSKRTHVRYVICLHALVLTLYTYVRIRTYVRMHMLRTHVRRETLRVRTYVRRCNVTLGTYVGETCSCVVSTTGTHGPLFLSKDDGDGDGDDGRHMFWTMSAVSSLCTAQASAQFGDKRHKQGGPSTYVRTYIRLRT